MYRKIIQSAIQFIRTEPVLAVSCVFALVSMTQVPPDSGYADYINVRVIAILAGLMIVMTGFAITAFFYAMCRETSVKDSRRCQQCICAGVSLLFLFYADNQ